MQTLVDDAKRKLDDLDAIKSENFHLHSILKLKDEAELRAEVGLQCHGTFDTRPVLVVVCVWGGWGRRAAGHPIIAAFGTRPALAVVRRHPVTGAFCH